MALWFAPVVTDEKVMSNLTTAPVGVDMKSVLLTKFDLVVASVPVNLSLLDVVVFIVGATGVVDELTEVISSNIPFVLVVDVPT